eukprot:CAMPEP_0185856746 /NCGR_PEP_ID=MMETSP1354-20130828/29156_1 /TAXON_ID=708628 /ORGANISM="Erythrolobus madagascarensis, Strain CCMP3276" /LENGTH=440 /DNA_ID=CAMNT_0028559007 /DNA_START=488 /DNA_END=1810 /DNA_ORIENTATION=-
MASSHSSFIPVHRGGNTLSLITMNTNLALVIVALSLLGSIAQVSFGSVLQQPSLSSSLSRTAEETCDGSCDNLEILLFQPVKDTLEVGETAHFDHAIASPCFKEWKIDFDDGSDKAMGTNQVGRASHQFSKVGKYHVKLTAYDSRGNKRCVTRTIHVVGDCPAGCDRHKIKSMVVDDRVVAVDESVKLSFKISSDRLTKWTVDFGDGSTEVVGSSMEESLTHKYTAIGKYKITLKAENECGEVIRKCKEVTVQKPGCCVHKIKYLKLKKNEISAGDRAEISFQIISDGFTAYEVRWGDGTEQTGEDLKDTLRHRFNTAGEYKIKLFAYNRCGDKVVKFVKVRVYGDCPPRRRCEQEIEKFAAHSPRCRPRVEVYFSFVIDSPCLDKWWIDWKDGSPKTYGTKKYGRVSHDFTRSGTFWVKLYVKNTQGDIQSKHVRVRAS